MKKALIITIFVGFVLNAAAFLFAAKPTIHWQFLFMLLSVVLIGAIVVDLILIPSLWNRHKIRAFIPFCVSLICLSSLVPTIVVGHALRNYLFKSRLDRYEAVIQMMMNGSIDVEKKLNKVELPPEYSNLAKATLAEKDGNGVLTVEFIIGYGFPLKHSGYLYRSEGTLDDWQHVDRWPVAIRMDDHWYKISD